MELSVSSAGGTAGLPMARPNSSSSSSSSTTTHLLWEDIRAEVPQRDLEAAVGAVELDLDDDQRFQRHRDVGRHDGQRRSGWQRRNAQQAAERSGEKMLQLVVVARHEEDAVVMLARSVLTMDGGRKAGGRGRWE
jgi:hypothetical protein